jgi:hypothetical protein
MKNKKHKIDIISKRLQGLINAWEIVSNVLVVVLCCGGGEKNLVKQWKCVM